MSQTEDSNKEKTQVIQPENQQVAQGPELAEAPDLKPNKDPATDNFHFSDSSDGQDISNVPATEDITWTAAEFTRHEKSIGWYLALAVTTIVIAALLYLLTGGIVTVGVVIVCAIVLGIFANHQPHQLEYALTRQGIRIGSKNYLYDEFQLYVITPGSNYPEVTLIPMKRFMPPLSLRYASVDEEKILGVLSQHLPSEERQPDLIDSFMRRIHF